MARLFVASAVLLFLELALIRWLAAFVIFLTFFTNFVLLAAFLGTSAGCLAFDRRTETGGGKRWASLRAVPFYLLATVVAARAVAWVYDRFGSIVVAVGSDPRAQQMVYFGTEYRVPDPSKIAVPVEAVAVLFFLLVALVFAGVGEAIGKEFAALRGRPLTAYAVNLGGNLAGIGAFALVSWASLPPVVWFAACFLGLGTLLALDRRLGPLPAAAMAATLAVAALPAARGVAERWSPYYLVQHHEETGEVTVNRISHQAMADPWTQDLAYSLPHLIRRDAGGAPFRDVLVIGAGTGNDVAHALIHGVRSVDAVEIDPVIAEIGRLRHPARPYDDPRVRLHVADGRSFLRSAAPDCRYDLAVYALVDSLVLHSAYASIRLESYLFTEEAFRDVARRLAPDGIFALYNYYRAGFIVARIAALARTVFGRDPIVFSLPYEPEIRADAGTQGNMTMILAGTDAALAPIETAFARSGGVFRLPGHDLRGAMAGNGFERAAAPGLETVGPARVSGVGEAVVPTDDWPFLYLREPTIPAHNRTGALLVAVISLGFIGAAGWRRRAAAAGETAPAPRPWDLPRGTLFFFLLGAGFLLLETKGVVHAALLFGSTWAVNMAVFAAILAMALASNLYAAAARPSRLAPYYVLLLLSLAAGYAIGLGAFLGESLPAKLLGVALLLFLPVLFSGVIFAATFASSRDPAIHIGANVAGAMVGGLAEYASLATGIRSLLLAAALLYALSWLAPKPAPGAAGQPTP